MPGKHKGMKKASRMRKSGSSGKGVARKMVRAERKTRQAKGRFTYAR